MDVRPRVSGRYDRQARLRAHLDGFHGILQVDCYAGYRALAETGHVQLAFCWSHVRRPFYEIAAGGDAPIATEALRRIADLYAIETEIRGRSADGRRNANWRDLVTATMDGDGLGAERIARQLVLDTRDAALKLLIVRS